MLRDQLQTSAFIVQTKIPLDLFAKYGRNSHSFLSLYKGYSYFLSTRGIEGTIPFIETSSCWVGASEPFAPKEVLPLLLLEFKKAAEAHGKIAVLLPVSEQMSGAAKRAGFNLKKIGTEPGFDLRNLKISTEQVTTAHRLHMKGATVTELHPRAMPSHMKHAIDALMEEWLNTRKMATLSFLNRVEPWTLKEHKKYFCLEVEGQIAAFVGAVPVPEKKGWYLVDIFRKSTAPVGSVELLLLQAMKILQRQGAEFASLGFAPLAEVPGFLSLVYKYGNIFYNFKSLNEFKMKMGPTTVEANFLCYSSPKFSIKILKSIAECSLGGNLIETTLATLERKLQWADIAKGARESLSDEIVLKDEVAPKTIKIRTMKTAFSLSLLFVFFFFFFHGDISTPIPNELTRFGFSLEALDTLNLKAVLVSPFLQRNFAEIFFGASFYFLTAFILECLAGPTYVAVSFFLGAFCAPLAASLFIYLPLKKILPSVWDHTYFALIIGTTLPILANIGATLRFLSKGKAVLVLASVLLAATGLSASSPRCFFDITALTLGFWGSGFVLNWYLPFYNARGKERASFTFGPQGASLPYFKRKER